VSNFYVYDENSKKNMFLRICPRYDMYGGESRVTSVVAGDPATPADQQPNLEPGPALEFVTLANGETIW
jgi:hypothetical protein